METKTVADLTIALRYAKEKHHGQMYGDKPYMFHINSVLNNCRELDLNMDCQIIAVLHDVLEDACHTKEEFDFTYGEIRELFGDLIAHTVLILTKYESEAYQDYIIRVREYAFATTVKFCDILANLEASIISGDAGRVRKYKNALYDLGEN